MRAVRYEAFGTTPEVIDLPDPSPSDDGVVLEVTAAGLCRSDWHGWQGHDDAITELPHVPGHEITGTVTEVGRQVSRWRPGDRVIVPFVCGCGTCLTCETGEYQVCPAQWQPGFHGAGGFAERVAIPFADANLVRVPAGVSDAAAAALGCRTATAYRALTLIAGLRSGEELLVYGAGGVGLSAIMIARALGARTTVIDPDPQARDLARHLGAALALDPTAFEHDSDLVAAVVDATNGGAQVSLDAIGAPGVPRQAILSLRRRGRHVQVGLLPHGAEIPMPRVIGWELAVLGSHGLAGHHYPELLALIADGRVRPDAMVSRVIGLEEVPEALAAMDTSAHPAGVTIVEPGRL